MIMFIIIYIYIYLLYVTWGKHLHFPSMKWLFLLGLTYPTSPILKHTKSAQMARRPMPLEAQTLMLSCKFSANSGIP